MKALSFRSTGFHLRHVFQPARRSAVITTTIRHRSVTAGSKGKANSKDGRNFDKSRWANFSERETGWPTPPVPPKVEELPQVLAVRAQPWSKSSHVLLRLIRFGVPADEVQPALAKFLAALREGRVLETLEYGGDMLESICYDISTTHELGPTDVVLTRLFYAWASHPSSQTYLENAVSITTLRSIRELFRCADMSMPAAGFTHTRIAPPRKIIMHVGPTNSGKTHHALRALAAAKRGCYAGPLRLLAHEIFMRLNNGQIVPLGVDPGPVKPDPSSLIEGADMADGPVVSKDGDKRFARPCNLITGEERIAVAEDAPLSSCTVEMAPILTPLDVAVVDEIQMLADPERGGAWANAVLGITAHEMHLCGEEAAVPLVQGLLKHTGDEIIVNRYERLTPLQVAKTSMNGSLQNVEKGDCVVAFSRSNIFKTKNEIERLTGLKCALVYGGLPAEVRNEQAKLFNDPKSGYDVIVGSDAIGMGLNLKIKRVIFSSVHKSDGKREVLLGAPQIKQIAGRAGRYGLHGTGDGGVATTLHPGDLPILAKALALSPEPIRFAHIRANEDSYKRVQSALPYLATFSTMVEAIKYVAKMDPWYRIEDAAQTVLATREIETIVKKSSLSRDEMFLLQDAPVVWRHELAVKTLTQYLRMYQKDIYVDVRKAVEQVGLLDKLNKVLRLADEKDEKKVELAEVKIAVMALWELETLHKTLCVYLWLSFRLPIAFHDYDAALVLKASTERAIWWTLQQVSRQGITVADLTVKHNRHPSKSAPQSRGRSKEGKFGRDRDQTSDDHRLPFHSKSKVSRVVF